MPTCVHEDIWCYIVCCEVGEGNAIAIIIMIQTCLVEIVEDDRYKDDSEGTGGR